MIDLFFIVGAMLTIVGAVWFVAVAFRISLALGIWCLLLGCLFQLILLVKNPKDTWKPFSIQLFGILLLFVGLGMSAEDPLTSSYRQSTRRKSDIDDLYDAVREKYQDHLEKEVEELRKDFQKAESPEMN